MKFTTILFATFATYASVSAAPQRGRGRKGAAAGATTTSATGATATVGATTGGAVTRGDSTIVMKEVGGIPGNECLTFRNNGEMVDAACVNEAADRQVTPSTSASGADILLVQRSFSAGFRPDLVGVDACVGFNGTTFLAQDCASADFQPVSLVAGQLTAGTACQSGHDDAAQLTVDPTGQKCVGVTTTDVAPTAP